MFVCSTVYTVQYDISYFLICLQAGERTYIFFVYEAKMFVHVHSGAIYSFLSYIAAIDVYLAEIGKYILYM